MTPSRSAINSPSVCGADAQLWVAASLVSKLRTCVTGLLAPGKVLILRSPGTLCPGDVRAICMPT
jgi:hypothetical protein